MTNAMIRRVAAVEATLARFQGKPFVWGRNDCVRLAVFALKKQGVKVSLLKAGSYRSQLGATKALKGLGYKTIEEAVDSLGLPRIAPAMALPGDIIAMPGDSGTALAVAVGNGRVVGFWVNGCEVVQPLQFITAWRSI